MFQPNIAKNGIELFRNATGNACENQNVLAFVHNLAYTIEYRSEHYRNCWCNSAQFSGALPGASVHYSRKGFFSGLGG